MRSTGSWPATESHAFLGTYPTVESVLANLYALALRWPENGAIASCIVGDHPRLNAPSVTMRWIRRLSLPHPCQPDSLSRRRDTVPNHGSWDYADSRSGITVVLMCGGHITGVTVPGRQETNRYGRWNKDPVRAVIGACAYEDNRLTHSFGPTKEYSAYAWSLDDSLLCGRVRLQGSALSRR